MFFAFLLFWVFSGGLGSGGGGGGGGCHIPDSDNHLVQKYLVRYYNGELFGVKS